MQTAFEGTMTNLEAYADSLQGPIGAFHQLAEAMGLVAGITLPTTGTAAPTAGTTTPTAGGKVGSLGFDGVTGGPAPAGPSISEEAKNTLQDLMQGILNNGGDQMLSNMPVPVGPTTPRPIRGEGDDIYVSPEHKALVLKLKEQEKIVALEEERRAKEIEEGTLGFDMGMRLGLAKEEYEKTLKQIWAYMEKGVGDEGYQEEYLYSIDNTLNRGLTNMPVPPITEFNAELKAKLAEYAAAFASSVQTVGINGAQTTVTMYNQIPITITINDAQDMNTADLAEQVEEAVGRAIRASGGSYISSTTGSISG
jgi:hypothetical protein